ncbi:MAG: PQQ-binding-like beta-propeller repeat protein [Coriobacteriaceae bacterium]|nr:PQQ-binding-like beta-propeller repeat protein [Coriobacteriaceae bacterium]
MLKMHASGRGTRRGLVKRVVAACSLLAVLFAQNPQVALAAQQGIESSWPGYGVAANTTAPTPTGDAEGLWTLPLKDPSDWKTQISDPICAGDSVYAATGARLLKIDPATGAIAGEAALAAPINSIARMLYAEGLVIVPLEGGRLQAFEAGTLAPAWQTPELPAHATGGPQQSLSTLTYKDGSVYFGTASADWSTSYNGYLARVTVATGETVWAQENTTAGYYWAGAAWAGSYLVIGDDAGVVHVVDPATGADVATVQVEGKFRTTMVAGEDGSTVFGVTSDGVLHRFAVAQNGAISETGSVKFAQSSTSTPTVFGNSLAVGGMSEKGDKVNQYVTAYYGMLSIIDIQSMQITETVTTADGAPIHGGTSSGDVKSAPVVSVRESGTYVYFTSNNKPGGVYRYQLGSGDAHLMFMPDEAHQNFCMASIAVGPDGALYYTNDSGALFAIAGDPVTGGGDGEDGGQQGGGDSGQGGDTDPDTKPDGGQGGNGSDQGGDNSGQDGKPGAGTQPGSGQGGSVTVPNGGTGGVAGPAGSASAGSSSKKTASTTEKKSSKRDDAEDGDEGASGSKADAKDGAAKQGADRSGADERAASNSGAVSIILPVVGIAIGVAGLIAIVVWFVRQRGM